MADVYDAASRERAFIIARRTNTYSQTFVQSVLEQDGAVAPVDLARAMSVDGGVLGKAVPRVHIQGQAWAILATPR